MKKTVGPFAYICECGKKLVFAPGDANTTRRCDCGRMIIVERQAVCTKAAADAQNTAVSWAVH